MKPSVIAIGASRGGLCALQALLGELPEQFPTPIVIAQHRHHSFDEPLSDLLSKHTSLIVKEGEDKDPLKAGVVYIGPANYHLLIDKDALALSTEGPVNHARPSIDVLFESVAYAFAERAVGVVLTGSSSDGARGAALICHQGGAIIIEDPATAEASVMPQAALATAQCARVKPLKEIAHYLKGLCSPR
jgi:two-component system chemotaxis response regulator CheB